MFTAIRNFFVLFDNLFLFIAYALIIVVVFWLFGKYAVKKLMPKIASKFDKQDKISASKILFEGFALPLEIYIKISGVLLALLTFLNWRHRIQISEFMLNLLNKAPGVLGTALKICTIIMVAWGLVRSNEISSLLIKNARNKLDLNVSASVRHFLSAIYNVVVIGIASVAVLKEMGVDINGLIAGLGLGGLTIALAAKDSASNFFGGLVIVMEKPFEIGDWIESQGISGSVEDINLRSTKIRTSDGSLTIVPNSVISGSAITNWSGAMEVRRAKFNLIVQYNNNKETIKTFCSDITALLENDSEVMDDGILVRFSDFNTANMEIIVAFNTTLPGYNDHMRIKERVNYGIIDIAEKLGIEFAYPTTNINVKKEY